MSKSLINIPTSRNTLSKTGSIRPDFCDVLERLAQQVDPGARVWRGSDLSAAQQSVTVLGTPLGRAEFVHAQLNQKLADHDTLLSRIPLMADVQSAWALLLHYAGARANYSCEWSDLNWSTISPQCGVMEMFGTHHPDKCGSRWNSESNSIPASGHGRNGSARCVSHQSTCFLGPVGLIVCPWFMTDTQRGHDDGPAAECRRL